MTATSSTETASVTARTAGAGAITRAFRQAKSERRAALIP